MADRAQNHDRLDGWKAIAAVMGRDERTLMRWEAARGLPIRRMPGQGKASVFAYRSDLEAWIAGAPPPDDRPAAQPTPDTHAPQRQPDANANAPAMPRSHPMRRLAGVAAAAIAVLAGVLLARPIEHPRAHAAASADPRAQALYLQGRYLWNRRTPASLDGAAAAFGAAISRDPRYAAAYAGLADTYLLMREFGTMPDAQAFPRASTAADAALALDPALAAAARARAFVHFWWKEDRAAGLAAFRAAIALAPGDAQTHHWYATALAASGDHAAALDEIESARRLDPMSTAILTDRGLILFQAGHIDEAATALGEIIVNEPRLPVAHAYLAGALLAHGHPAGFLREALVDARLRRDPVAEAIYGPGVKELATLGRAAMLVAVAARAERALSDGRFGRLGVAQLEAIAGHDERAGELVKAATDRHDVGAFQASADHWLAGVGARRASGK